MPKEKKNEVDEKIIDADVEEVNGNKKALDSLKEQYKEYKEKADHFALMSTKALGAIEVLTQLEKETNEG